MIAKAKHQPKIETCPPPNNYTNQVKICTLPLMESRPVRAHLDTFFPKRILEIR